MKRVEGSYPFSFGLLPEASHTFSGSKNSGIGNGSSSDFDGYGPSHFSFLAILYLMMLWMIFMLA